MQKGKLIVVSAPSGSGKTTLVRHLLTEIQTLSFSISCTTRQARPGETDKQDYYFISNKSFQEKIENEEFAEWEEVYPGLRYGTLKSEIERITTQGRHVIFDIDVQGALSIKKLYPDESLAIYIDVPDIDSLAQRLRDRNTESEEKLQMRISKAKEEQAFANRFDTILVNDELERAKAEIVRIVKDFIGMAQEAK